LGSPSDLPAGTELGALEDAAFPLLQGGAEPPVAPAIGAAVALSTEPSAEGPSPVGLEGLPGSAPGGGLNGGEVLPPIIDIVDDVVRILDPVVDDVLAPVLGSVGDIVDGVVRILDPVVDDVLAPVLGGVGDIVDGVVRILDPVVDDVLAPVLGGVGGVAESIVAPVLGIATPLVTTIAQGLDSVVRDVTAPLADIVGDVAGDGLRSTAGQVVAPFADILDNPIAALLGTGSGGGVPILASVVASPGSISFASAAGSLPLDLFAGGRYTDYNLALRTDATAATASSPGAAGDVTAAANDILSAIAGNPSSGTEHAPPQPIGVPSLLDDIGLRGLSDGLGL
jgi:hypothetical protein